MPLIIAHNLLAATVMRSINKTYKGLSQSVRRLSSGLRINSAADDPVGLAIRDLMRANVASLNQGIRNTNDAISMVQTADGALNVIDQRLLRMKELALQASTGTYSPEQRLALHSEYQTIASEITRIANATDFNGIKLLNGSLSGTFNGDRLQQTGPIRVHFGNTPVDYYDVRINGVTAEKLGLIGAGGSISTQADAQQALAVLDSAISSKDSVRANLGGLHNRLESTIESLQVQSESLQIAESRISDADIALEMTNFIRYKILLESGIAMLAQANSIPKLAQALVTGRNRFFRV